MTKKEFSFVCSDCGDEHTGSPSFSYQYPRQYFDVPEEFRGEYVTTSDDLCRIKPFPNGVNQHTSWFIRVILEVPIIGVEAPFTWGVWVSQSEDKFGEYCDGFGTDQSLFESFGWLSVNLPYYKSLDDDGFLESLACDVHGRGEGTRPIIYLHEIEHQLYKDQVYGITWDNAVEIATICMHS